MSVATAVSMVGCLRICTESLVIIGMSMFNSGSSMSSKYWFASICSNDPTRCITCSNENTLPTSTPDSIDTGTMDDVSNLSGSSSKTVSNASGSFTSTGAHLR